MDKYREAISQVLDRYEAMIHEFPEPSGDLLDFITEFRSVLDTHPLTKLNRLAWLHSGCADRARLHDGRGRTRLDSTLFRPLDFEVSSESQVM